MDNRDDVPERGVNLSRRQFTSLLPGAVAAAVGLPAFVEKALAQPARYNEAPMLGKRVQAGEAALGNVLGKIHGSAGFMVEVLGARAGLRRSRQAERQKRQADGHGHEANDPQGLRGLGHRGAHRAAP